MKGTRDWSEGLESREHPIPARNFLSIVEERVRQTAMCINMVYEYIL